MNRRRAVSCGVWALVAATVLLGGCGSGHEDARAPAGPIEFGIWVSAPRGEPRFVATDRVPNVEDQAYGWRTRVDSRRSYIKWVESMTLPVAPESWAGVGEDPNIVLSDDGRTSTKIGVSEPVDGYVENLWYVAVGDPPGDYEMSVELEDGRKATFRFKVSEADPRAGAI